MNNPRRSAAATWPDCGMGNVEREFSHSVHRPNYTPNDPARMMGVASVMETRMFMKLRSIRFCLIWWSLWPLVSLVQPDGRVAYYPIDGNAVEATGSGLNGVVFNATFSAGN